MAFWRRQGRRQPETELRHHATLSPPAAGLVPVSTQPTCLGDLITLWSTPEGLASLASRTTPRPGVSFADTRASQPVEVVVTVHDPHPRVVARLRNLEIAFPLVDLLPGDRVLIVGARASLRPEGPEKNAVVYSADGDVVVQGCLGDGIQHVQTTSAGEVWVGYFDEGVYGHFGSGEGGKAEPLGACGLAVHDASLRRTWAFPAEEAPGVIDDCYALNVTDARAWTCYYSDWPLVRIRDAAITSWANDVAGARAVLAAGDAVALVGGYADSRDRIVQGSLQGSDVVWSAPGRLALPGGRRLPASVLHGRGGGLHLVDGLDWYRLDLSQV